MVLDTKTEVQFLVSRKTHEKIKRMAKSKKLSMKVYIDRLIEYIEEKGGF